MRSGDRFIKKFNELVNILRQKTGLDEHTSFSRLVDEAANTDPTVRRRREILKSLGSLRNAIVHDRDYPERILADPRSESLEELDRMLAAIASPDRLIPRFQKQIRVFTVDESLAECLSFMKKHDFSQVVVVDGSTYRLLSSEGIVQWLESALNVGPADLEEATVGNAHECEYPKNCVYLSRDDPVDAAVEAFEKAIQKGIPRLQAILVTERGRQEERPLGIVTPWDLIAEVGHNGLA